METTLDLPAAMGILDLVSLPRNRQELARRVAARHPASSPWSGKQTAAYRAVWEALDTSSEETLAA
jgi:hypothetical protein